MVEPTRPQGDRDVVSGTWEGTQAQFRARRVIVKLRRRPDVDAIAAVQDIASALPGGQVARAPSRTGRIVYDIGPDAEVTAVARDLANRDDVEYAEPDVIDHAALTPNDTRLSEQWSHATVGSFGAWDL